VDINTDTAVNAITFAPMELRILTHP
jgi:hypothetical protein